MKVYAGIPCALSAALVLQFLPGEATTREITREASARHLSQPPSASRARSPAHGIVHGQARVIDGDTIEIAGERIRLEGIDAPEIDQQCPAPPSGRTFPAGNAAAAALERWVRGRPVTCRGVGRDRYGRLLARCEAAGIDLNQALVRGGLAWAFVKYSHIFVEDERQARVARLGVWAAGCETAWDYRSSRWGPAASLAPSGCAIKGNITAKGRVYHMPWSPWYARTRIDTAKGERWFCDERQALAAGWRPAVFR